MVRNLFAAWGVPLLLVACAPGVATRPISTLGSSDSADTRGARPADGVGSSEFVESVRDYGKPRDIPAQFQHLVDWHAGTGPVVLLFTAGGRRACAVGPWEAVRVLIRRPYRCHWSAAR